MMLFKFILVAVPLVAGQCVGQNQTANIPGGSVPNCRFTGYGTGRDMGFYSDPQLATYAACNDKCNANNACLSFSYNPGGPNCILYDYAVEGIVVADLNSPNIFFNRGGVCPATATVGTTPLPNTQPTCKGFVGYDKGTNIGFYADPVSATYGGCLQLCNANADCLSFGLTSAPACILYNYTIEGNDVAAPNSGNTFYNRGGVCPEPISTTPPAPPQTGPFANCPAGIFPYDVTTGATPHGPCDPKYPYSSCQKDVGGGEYCNLCLACTDKTCTSDADCEAGHACITNSECTVPGKPAGTAVCLYMLDGGAAHGCYNSPA